MFAYNLSAYCAECLKNTTARRAPGAHPSVFDHFGLFVGFFVGHIVQVGIVKWFVVRNHRIAIGRIGVHLLQQIECYVRASKSIIV